METNDEKIERLIKENFKPCLLICKKFTKDVNEAELLRSHVFEKIWKYKDNFQGSDSDFKSWLYIITKNTFISNYRVDKKKGQHLSIEDNFDHPTINNFDEHSDNISLINKITYTIDDEFSGRDAKIFKMNTYEGYKYIELADYFNIPLGTIKLVIHKVRKFISNKRNIKNVPFFEKTIIEINTRKRKKRR